VPFTALASEDRARAQAVVTVTAVDISPIAPACTCPACATAPSSETLNVRAATLLNTGLTQSPLTDSEPLLPWMIPAGGQVPFRLVPQAADADVLVAGSFVRSNNIP
jgi:hypothetical protein